MEPEPVQPDDAAEAYDTKEQYKPSQAQPPSGPPPPHTTTTPTEYTPAFLVRAYDEFMKFISVKLGNHIYSVLQEMRADAEKYGSLHKEKPKHVLAQLLAEIKDWRHIPVSKTDSNTVLDEEVDAVRRSIPHLMAAVEDAKRTGTMVLSGSRGQSVEGVTIKVPAMRDFVNDVYMGVAQEYSGRNGVARLVRHLTRSKDKFIGVVKHVASTVLFPQESVWGMEEDVEKEVPVAPAPAAQQHAARKTIQLRPGQPGEQQEDKPPAEGEAEFKDDELGDGGSDSGGSQEASEADGF